MSLTSLPRPAVTGGPGQSTCSTRFHTSRRVVSTTATFGDFKGLSRSGSTGQREVAESLEALAGLAVQRERCAEAARLFGAASTLREQMALARWPVQIAGYERDVAHIRKTLGEDAFAAAWTEGVALSVDEAVSYATQAPVQRQRRLQS